MHGKWVGKLLVATNATFFPVMWMQSGEKGDVWINGKVQLQKNATNPFKVSDHFKRNYKLNWRPPA